MAAGKYYYDFEVWPDNWQASQVLWSLRHRWQVIVGGGSAIYQGLNRGEIESTFRMMKIEDMSGLMDQLLFMETNALEVLNGE